MKAICPQPPVGWKLMMTLPSIEYRKRTVKHLVATAPNRTVGPPSVPKSSEATKKVTFESGDPFLYHFSVEVDAVNASVFTRMEMELEIDARSAF